MQPWLYIALLGGLIIVFGAMLPRRNVSQENSSSIQSMEAALEQFMENMEAENLELIDLVSKSRKEAAAQSEASGERISKLESRCAELEMALAKLAKDVWVHPPSPSTKASATVDAEISVPPDADTLPDLGLETGQEADMPPSIRSRYQELFDLYAGGKSVDAIARKLGMNKGEVQLILQLSKREEAARHE